MSFQVDGILEKGKMAANLAKNFVLNYTETEVKVREATNNDHWGPSGTEMAQIASMSHKFEQFNEIMSTIYKRFTESGKTWRQIYKSLILLEYLIKNGSERVAEYASEHVYEVKALMHYNHIDEKGKDQGINVRNRSKEIVLLLQDPARIHEERQKANSTKNKYFSVSSDESRSNMGLNPGYDSDRYNGSGSNELQNDSRSSSKTDFRNVQLSNSSQISEPIPYVPSPSKTRATPTSTNVNAQKSSRHQQQEDPFGPAATNDEFGDFSSAQGNDFGDFASATHTSKPAPVQQTSLFGPTPTTSAPSNSFFTAPAPTNTFSAPVAASQPPRQSQPAFDPFGDILTGDSQVISSSPALFSDSGLLVPQSQQKSSTSSSSSSSHTQTSHKAEEWGSGLVNLDNLKKYDTGKEKKEAKPMGPSSRPTSTTSSYAQPQVFGAQQGMYAQPQQGMYAQPQQGMYAQPQQGMYAQPQQGMYAQPQQGMYGQPQQGMYGARPMGNQMGAYPQSMGGFPQSMGGFQK